MLSAIDVNQVSHSLQHLSYSSSKLFQEVAYVCVSRFPLLFHTGFRPLDLWFLPLDLVGHRYGWLLLLVSNRGLDVLQTLVLVLLLNFT